MKMTTAAHLSLILLSLIGGAHYIVGKWLVPQYIDASALVLIRAVSGWAFFEVLYRLSSASKPVSRTDLPLVILSAFMGIVLNQLLFVNGLSRTTPVNAAVMMLLIPVIVLIVGTALKMQKPTRINLLGIGIAFVAAYMLVAGPGVSYTPETLGGDLMILANATSFAVYLLLVKPIMQKYDAFTVLRYQYLIGMLLIAPFGIAPLLATDYTPWTHTTLWAMVFIIVGIAWVSYFINTWVLKHLSAHVVGSYIYLHPIFAMGFAYLSGIGIPTTEKILYSLVVIVGVFLATRPGSAGHAPVQQR